ncbi:hypothetical protein EDE04_7386 [Streptomyces sp. 2132.2]|uniref:hypothetical protein n=1 Tax=Streptomyces sp. 2132.2 TaxID=2485161 RepID=UPI000F463C71|nr:hypothetical protein [Streptomyces sp. 2132.2]ROQ88991.1 hypothetical protein EDE04_7386 [Streptomyces sp. 2132.2]
MLHFELLNHPEARAKLGDGGRQGMSYADAVANGVPAVAASVAKTRDASTGKQYGMTPAGLAVFISDGVGSALEGSIREMRGAGWSRAWTGGKVDLTNKELEGKSRQELASAPLTGPLLLLPDDPSFFDGPEIKEGGRDAMMAAQRLGYRFTSGDPADKCSFLAAYSFPSERERALADGKVLADPTDGVRTEKSDTGVQKINAKATARISSVGADGKAGLELHIAADLFSWYGVSIIGAWGRADQAQVIGAGTLRRPDGAGQYLSDANRLEQLREEVTVGGYLGMTLKFKERLAPGQPYVLDWTCTRPSHDGTRDRQHGVSVSGKLSFTL